ncbi:DNA damage-inducible transcript 4-like protein [Tubulanus polymorphus]|uniref:DNA damage-inducible transcript 4-like protein n=1 Tax=Tubulanus polymorphus TaxID=672921 RepID=UPI003DA624F9
MVAEVTVKSTFQKLIMKVQELIERDYITEANNNSTQLRRKRSENRRASLSYMMSADAVGYNSYEESLVLQERLFLIGQIEELMRTAKIDLSLDDVLIPSGLTSKISQDVLNMSQNEPYGLRGCVIHVNLECATMCHRIGRIHCDPDTVSTFEIYLTLKEDSKKWTSITKMIPVLDKFMQQRKKTVLISAAYTAEKRKLYGS